jgi:hypothetical protein
VTLILVPHSSSLTTFFCLPVAWLTGSVDFVARLAGLGRRVCPPQSVRATSLICDTLHVCRPHLSVRTPGCLLFRAAAHAALPSDHPWTKRVRRASLLLPESLPSAPTLIRYLCCHVLSQASVAWECALAPYPAVDNVSARGRRRGSGPPEHLNPLRSSLSMRSPPSAALALACSACVPLPLYPLGPPSFLSLCALGIPPVAWALSSF